MPTTAPYGSWKSPITTDLIVAGTVGLGSVQIEGDRLYWIESRPAEGGRSCVVECDANGVHRDLIPAPFNARTRVHEYGGGACLVHGGVLYFSNFSDQRLYAVDLSGEPGAPEPVTEAGDLRFADAVADPRRDRLICVCEDHGGPGEAVNSIVAIDLGSGEITTLLSGYDFYSSPRLDPDGAHLAWICWNHPQMPWDGTELFVAGFDGRGLPGTPTLVSGGPEESVVQPRWSPDGVLHFTSDRSGWWNLYRREGDSVRPLHEMAAEFSSAHWNFGLASYGFRSARELVCCYSERGSSHLATIDLVDGSMTAIESPYTVHGSIHVAGDRICLIGASPTASSVVAEIDLAAGEHRVIRRSSSVELPAGYYSVPEAIEFPTAGGRAAHAFYYRPANRDFTSTPGEKPPLLAKIHGGPTAAASNALDLGIQYWTSRGIGVVDVNYGGSTGYGREYRKRLDGNWGVVDLDDTEAAARFLVARGDADPERLAIRGGSAGGYTTLAILTFRDLFKAGASYYGVSDLETLARDTHKFESRYLDSIVGPYPARADLYRERSPIHHVAGLSCPIIFFQGSEDRVVPPAQAEDMVNALRAKGLPVAYLLFDGEQHGFRRAENIKRTLDAELYFYSRIFGFTPADPIDPVPIENL